MSDNDHGTRIIPCLRYHDAARAIDFLCQAFGFERHLVVPAEGGGIVHAQLVQGGRMVMLGSHKTHGEFDKLMTLPGAAGGCTQAPYVVVEDTDAHHARAVAAGAEIVMPPEDWDHGGRGYTCRDLEGHVWSFGTYDPWTAQH